MTGQSPRNVSLFTALITGLAVGVISIGVQLILAGDIDTTEVLLMVGLGFAAAWVIFYSALQKFVYQKIRLIFKNIHSLKVQGRRFDYNMKKDVIGSVNRQVAEWAQDRLAEIEDLKVRENFRKEFLGNVAHELKTPIFSIQGYIETLLEGALEDPAVNRKFLENAARSVERMTVLLEDLDTINQLESGSLKLNIARFDLATLVREVAESREYELHQQDMTLRLGRDVEKPLFVKGDAFRISQVLNNLISNAINYGRKGGRISVRFFDMDENILVEVEDNGPGIAPEHLPRLFERFYRVDKSRSRHQGGTGLGLAICKHILEGHGQPIHVRSDMGRGSVFSFTLAKG